MTAIIVIAKQPEPGRSKTRLSPPLSPAQAADVASAALSDTLDAVRSASADRRVLALDGDVGAWSGCGLDVIAQRGAGLDERIAAAFADVGGPALLIGMDTPQVDAAMLDDALAVLDGSGCALGAALDGGWWALGLHAPAPEAVLGVPMSSDRTCDEQRRRLRSLGLAPVELPVLRDVDRWEDALAVAEAAPETRFASTVARLQAAVRGCR